MNVMQYYFREGIAGAEPSFTAPSTTTGSTLPTPTGQGLLHYICQLRLRKEIWTLIDLLVPKNWSFTSKASLKPLRIFYLEWLLPLNSSLWWKSTEPPYLFQAENWYVPYQKYIGNIDVCYRSDGTAMMGEIRKKKMDDMARKSWDPGGKVT